MKPRRSTSPAHLLAALLLISCATIAPSQQPEPGISPTTAPENSTTPAPTNPSPTPPETSASAAFIHQDWNNLSRAMTDCHSLVDTKVSSHPILYLPLNTEVPANVTDLEIICGVTSVTLPVTINKLGDLKPHDLDAPGPLYLPLKHIAPDSSSNEMTGWQSYFIILGLIADQREDIARAMVENFYFEIEHYGAVLSSNRTDYLTRSQPPLLTAMMRAVYEATGAFRQSPTKQQWLERGYELATKDYETWTRPENQAGNTGLARYWDYGDGPAPELPPDSTYYADVIRWLIAHPQQNPGFLIKASATPDAAELSLLKRSSCDLTISVACEHAYADGFRLTADFYHGDRAMREAGFTNTFRFEAFAGATHHYAPVCLNSLLYRYERDMAHFAHILGKPVDADNWETRARRRSAAIQQYLWQPKSGVFADYDFIRVRPSPYADSTSLYPLWAGVATRDQARQVESKLSLFERPGGLSVLPLLSPLPPTSTPSGTPDGEPYGSAPANWIAIAGLDAYDFKDDARRIAQNFTTTIDNAFLKDHTIREKYNVAAPDVTAPSVTAPNVAVIDQDVQPLPLPESRTTDYAPTSGVYLVMQQLIAGKWIVTDPPPKEQHLPLGLPALHVPPLHLPAIHLPFSKSQ